MLNYREKFFAYSNYPYVCYFCLDVVDPENLFVHHIDEDGTNHAITNLAAAHPGCHTRHHHSGKVTSEETRRKISEGGKGKGAGWKHTDEARAKISAGLIGNKNSPTGARGRGVIEWL